MNSIGLKKGYVSEIIKDYDDIQEIIVEIDKEKYGAINYKMFTGTCSCMDEVLLNTSAIDLKLGTGGYHFVYFNYNNDNNEIKGSGHIMKLRYTPLQFKCFSVEEQESPFHKEINEFESLFGHPIAVGTLHSQVSVFFEAFKKFSPQSKTVYIMTDGAALPISLSNNIRKLKEENIIDYTITSGNSFGGDFEAVNVYTAIIMAREVLKAGAIMICMGPGIVGTGTKYGFTGIEQGYILDSIASLGGTPVAIPRVSFKDFRSRHHGLSHHTLTILKDIVKTQCIVPFAIDDENSYSLIENTINTESLLNKHNFINYKKNIYSDLVADFVIRPKSMGRSYKDDPYLFNCSIAAAEYISERID